MIKNERLPHIDIAKGILIILVVVGHVLTGSNFVTKVMIRVINSFHMPAFFIISGMLMNTEKLRKQPFAMFLKKKAVRLLVPYVVFELIGAVWQMILLESNRLDIVEVIHRILTARCYVGADWFLIALFFAEMILYWTNKYICENGYMFVAVVAFLLAFYLPDKIWFLENLRRIMNALGHILIGMRWKDFFLRNSVRCFMLCAAGLIAGSAFNDGAPSMGLGLLIMPVVIVFCGICGTMVALFISRKLSACGKVGNAFEQCGRASLVIMGTHQNVIVPFYIRYRVWTALIDKIGLTLLIILVEIPLVLFCKRFVPTWVSEVKMQTTAKNRKYKDNK